MHPDYALNTLAAPWWRLKLASIFGHHISQADAGGRMHTVHWRGVTYMIGYKPHHRVPDSEAWSRILKDMEEDDDA